MVSLTTIAGNSNELVEMKWTPVLVLSFLFHLVVFSAVFFVPGSSNTIRHFGGVYEVNLVEMPGGGGSPKPAALSAPREVKSEAPLRKETKVQRIEEVKSEQKPLVVAKKTVEKTVTPAEKPRESPSELLERAISKIEKKVKSDNPEHLDRALSNLQAKIGSGGGTGSGEGPMAGQGGGMGGTGGPMALYQMQVEAKIKSNWSYPVAMDRPKDLEAVVVLTVKQDGTIIRSRIEKRSSSVVFDESVLKAVERSDPLPPFPESYRKSYDEIEINFNLKDFEGR